MKRYFIQAFYIGFFLLIFSLQGCSELQVNNSPGVEGETITKESVPESKGNAVTKELAVYVANHFANDYGFSYQNLLNDKKVKRKGKKKEIEHILPLKGKNRKTALYLINYKEKGFVIISGDKRVSPVLAYSELNVLPTTMAQKVPEGFAMWIDKTIKGISKFKKTKNKGIKDDHFGWKALLNAGPQPPRIIEEPDEPTCEPTVTVVGPLLQTTWGQGAGYNNFAPYRSCSTTANGRAPAGCVATAIAQVMRYHAYPQWYDWNLMPNTYGNDYVSGLMLNIADRVGMNWGCNGSGAGDDDMDNVFQGYGYSSAVHQINYEGTSNYDIVEDELDAGRPVIFSGCGKDYFIFPYPAGCHAWVGDGYRRGKICPEGHTYLQFHMNWGWNGSYNGFYGFSDFSPGDENYDYNSEVLVEIHP